MAEDYVFKIKAVPDLSGFEAALKSELKKLKLGFGVPAAFNGMGAMSKGGNTALSSMVHAERNATKALLNFSSAVTQATRGLSGFTANAAKGTRTVQAAAVSQSGGVSGKNANFMNAMMSFPGFAQVLGYAKAFPSMAINWSRGNIGLAETQQRAETQLSQILRNGNRNGKSYDSGTLARLKEAASAEQASSMYGDEAILGGVGELSTYVSDEATLKRMIPLLTDYAAGMTGGGAVDYRGMIDLATGLGKALDGTYENLRKKGFDTSELEALDERQKAGEKITDDMKVAALERALSDYKGLAKAMAETPMGIMEQMKNSIGDAREEAGFLMQETLLPIFRDLKEMLPDIQEGIKGIGEAASVIVSLGGDVASLAIPAFTKFAKHSNLVIGAVASGGAALLLAGGKMTKAFIEMTTAINASATAARNAASANGIDAVTKGISGLNNAIGSAVKGGLYSILAGEIMSITSAVYEAVKQKFKEWDVEKQRKAYNEISDAFLDARANYVEKLKKGMNTVSDFLDYQDAAMKLVDANKALPKSPGFARTELSQNDLIRLGMEEARQEGKKEGSGMKPPKLPKPVVNISADFNSVSRLVKENLTEILRSQLRVMNSYQAVNV